MNRKEGAVLMTIDDFDNFTHEALELVLKSTENSSPMTSMLVGATSTIAFGKLKKVIFGEDDEKDTDTDTDTETLNF